MFKSITKIPNIYSTYEIYGDYLICNIGDGKQSHITIFNQEFEQVNQLVETAYDFFVEKDRIVFTTQVIITDQKIMRSFSYDLRGNILRELPYTLYLRGVKCQYNLLCIGNEGYASPNKPKCYFLVDLNTLDVLEKIDTPLGLSSIDLFIENGIISSNKLSAKIGLFDLHNTVLWEYELSELASYQEIDAWESGKIRAVYQYKDSIIVLTQLFVFRIDTVTGKIIYQKQLPAGLMTLSIHENRAYGCYGYHFIEIDLETSDIVGFHRLEFENYDGNRHFALMNQPIFLEGLVYHGIRLEGGRYFVGAIEPSTGKRLWMHPLGVDNVERIEFRRNKMFIQDAGGYLHILEKELSH